VRSCARLSDARGHIFLRHRLRKPECAVIRRRRQHRRPGGHRFATRWLQAARNHDRRRHKCHALSVASVQLRENVAPVARLVRMVNFVVVHPSVPASTLGEFIAPVIEKSGIKGSL
jgi:hypothetical protein